VLRDPRDGQRKHRPRIFPSDRIPPVGHRERFRKEKETRGWMRRGRFGRGWETRRETGRGEARRGEARWRRQESPPTHNDILIKPRRWPSRGEIQSRDNKWSRPNTFLTADEPTPRQLKEFTPFPARPSKKWRTPRILRFFHLPPLSPSPSTLFIVCLIDTTRDSPLSLVSRPVTWSR